MSYVIYHKETTVLMNDKRYETERTAKSALTKMANEGKLKVGTVKESWAVAEKAAFHANIERWVDRKNLMTGEPFREPINTPIFCSPAFESYWQM